MIKITGHAKLISDSLYDGILIIDKEGIVRYINPAYTRITKVLKYVLEADLQM